MPNQNANVPDVTPFLASDNQNEFIKNHRKAWYANEARLNGMEVNEFLASNSSLPRDVWRQWDRVAKQVAREELTIYNALTPTLGKNINVGKSVDEFRRVTDQVSRGQWSIDGRAQPNADKALTDYIGTPVPFYVNAWGYGWSEYEAARSEGYDLNDDNMRNAMFHTARDMENCIVSGLPDIVYNGEELKGLVNHAKRKTVAKSVTNINGANGKDLRNEFIKITKAAQDVHQYGDLVCFVNWNDYRFMANTDYSDQYESKSILARCLEVDGVSEIIKTKNVNVPANTIIACVRSPDNLRVLSRLPMTTIPKFRLTQFDDFEFQIWASCSLQVKYDTNDSVGLVVFS